MKMRLNTIVWFAVPMLLAAGCAENRHDDASVSYSPTLTEPPSATLDRPEVRAYPAPDSSNTATAVPQGASPQDWALAEEIRSVLMSDRSLGKAPVTAVVNHGVVTLKGEFRNEKERQRVRNEIAQLPGVVRVDDQLEHRRPLGIGAGESRNY